MSTVVTAVSDDFDSRLRFLEQTLVQLKTLGEHHDRDMSEIKHELEEFLTLARKCENIDITERKVDALHLRVDRLSNEHTILQTHYEQTKSMGDKDSATLLSIQKDLISLTVKIDQLSSIKAQGDTNKMDIEALKITVKTLTDDNRNRQEFMKGRVGSLLDVAFKILVGGAIIGYLTFNGWRPPSQQAEQTLEHKAVTMESDSTYQLNDLKRQLDLHKAEDQSRAKALENSIRK